MNLVHRHRPADHRLDEAKAVLRRVLAGRERYRRGLLTAIELIEDHQHAQHEPAERTDDGFDC